MLDWIGLFGIAIGLAMDALAVSVAAGITVAPVTFRHTFRLAFHFGLFQFMMPIFGWLAGERIADSLSSVDHWIAFALLAGIGVKMIFDALTRKDSPSQKGNDPTRGLSLVTLSLATSIDAFAVGLSMAFMHRTTIVAPSLMIGLVAGTLSAIGVLAGGRIGNRWGHRAELLGGGILILIGLRIVLCPI